MYLGMHSLDQVLYSLALGWYLHLLYNALFRKWIQGFLLNILEKKDTN